MVEFIPFAATAQATSFQSEIDGRSCALTLDSDESRVVLYGELEIRRDQAGLDHARKLRDAFAALVADLEAAELNDEAVTVDPDVIVPRKNPLG